MTEPIAHVAPDEVPAVPAVSARPAEARPPLGRWKLALLMAATLSLYQFVWFRAIATDLKRECGKPARPLLWLFAPLLGPLVCIPVGLLAGYLLRWREEARAEQARCAEPALVVVLAIGAYVAPLWSMLYTPYTLGVFLSIGLLSTVPCLVLQHQRYLIRRASDASAFSGEPPRFSRRQRIAAIAGSLVAAPVYMLSYTGLLAPDNAGELAVKHLVTSDDAQYQIRVAAPGWSRVDEGYLSLDSEMEFLGPHQNTWAVVLDNSDSTLDESVLNRVRAIRSDHSQAECAHSKSVHGERLVLQGWIDCQGSDRLGGRYAYLSNTLAHDDRIIEMLGYTAHGKVHEYELMLEELSDFVRGLGLSDP